MRWLLIARTGNVISETSDMARAYRWNRRLNRTTADKIRVSGRMFAAASIMTIDEDGNAEDGFVGINPHDIPF